MGVFIKYKKEEIYVDNIADKSHDHHFTRNAWLETLRIIKEKGIMMGEGEEDDCVVRWGS